MMSNQSQPESQETRDQATTDAVPNNDLQDSENSGNGINPPTKDLPEELLELRLTFMRTIADVWKSKRQGEEPYKEPEYVIPCDPYSARVRNGEYILWWLALNLSSGINSVKASANENGDKLAKKVKEEEMDGFPSGREISLYDFNVKLADLLKNENIGKALNNLIRTTPYYRELVESSNPANLQSIWDVVYGYNSGFGNFGVHVIKPTARWNFYGDNQWTKPDTEVLFLSLPAYLPMKDDRLNCRTSSFVDNENQSVPTNRNNKEFDDQFVKAAICTQYYKFFPSFFGTNKAKAESRGRGLKGSNNSPFLELKEGHVPDINDTLELSRRTFDVGERDQFGNNYDLGIASDNFVGFSAMVTKLLTVLWNNHDVRKRMDYAFRLFNETEIFKQCKNETITFDSIYDFSYRLNNLSPEDKIKLKRFDKKYDQELEAIFRQYFSYISPWVFKIRILVPHENVFFKVDSNNANGPLIFNPDRDQILNLTTIEVPHIPKLNEANNVALALARYNATGPAYPFTCS